MKVLPQRRVTKKGILLVDDHPVMRSGLAQLISREVDMEVCGEAGDAAETLEKVEKLKPALVLTDLSLPGKSGLELIKDIVAAQPHVLVLVVSVHDESLYAERVLSAGARGYVMKEESGQTIIQAIRRVLGGEISVSEKVSASLLEVFAGHRVPGAGSSVEKLSDRELEIFQSIGRGLGTREIAASLHVSPKTVEAHRAHIKAKLNVSTHTELIRRAVRWDDSQDEMEP